MRSVSQQKGSLCLGQIVIIVIVIVKCLVIVKMSNIQMVIVKMFTEHVMNCYSRRTGQFIAFFMFMIYCLITA